MEPFDLQRIFLGETSWMFLLEVAFRSLVMYVFAIALLRLTGSRGIGQLSALDIVIIIALGSSVGDPMFYPNVPLLHGMVVITVIVLLQRGIGLLLVRESKVEAIMEGVPVTIIENGCLNLENIKQATLSLEDIFMKLRHQGIEHLGQVKIAYLEHDGYFSVFEFKSDASQPGLPIVTPRDIRKPETFKTGHFPAEASYFACMACGQIEIAGKNEPLPGCPRCKNEEWALANMPE